MTLKDASTNFKAFFLLEFAKQLIEHSKTDYVFALERLKKEEIKRKIKDKKEAKIISTKRIASVPERIILTNFRVNQKDNNPSNCPLRFLVCKRLSNGLLRRIHKRLANFICVFLGSFSTDFKKLTP